MMKNYLCTKCSSLVQSKTKPDSFNCVDFKLHNWVELGEVGPVTYECLRCGTLVNVLEMPPKQNCPAGEVHSWTRLA